MKVALAERLSLARFTGFALEDDIPDASAICRFRQSPVERDAFRLLLDKTDMQLEHHDLLVREGAIIVADVVSSELRPRKVFDSLPEYRQEDADSTPNVPVSYSDEVDASWLRKGNRDFCESERSCHLAVNNQPSTVEEGK